MIAGREMTATIALADVRAIKSAICRRMASTRRADALKWAELGQQTRAEYAAAQADALDLAARLLFALPGYSNAGGAE